MRSQLNRALVALALLSLGSSAFGNEVKGLIEAVDPAHRTLTVQGIVLHTTERTDYDDGLRRFEDLTPGQRVEVEFVYSDGRHLATEIELEDD